MGLVSELFLRFGLQTAALEAGLAKARFHVNETAREIKTKLKKETSEARDAGELLGRAFGVQLPRSVQRFITSVGPVRSLLAGAFSATVIGTFVGAVGVAIVKGAQWVQTMASGAGVLEAYNKGLGDAALRLNDLTRAQLVNIRESLRADQARLAQAQADLNNRIGPGRDIPFVSGMLNEAKAKKLAESQGKVTTEIIRINDALSALNKKGLAENREATEKAAAAAAKLLEQQHELVSGLAETINTSQMSAVALDVHKAALLGADEATLKLVHDLSFLANAATQALKPNLEKAAEAAKRLKEELRDIVPPDAGGLAVPGLGADMDVLIGKLKEAKKPLSDIELGLRDISANSLMMIGDAALGLTSWRNVARQIIADLGRMIFYLMWVRPLMSSIFGGFGFGGGFSFGGGFLSGANLGGLPPGEPLQHGGFARPFSTHLVGEAGPERLTTLGRGAVVTPLSIRGGSGGKGGVTIQVDARGADAAAEFRVERGIRKGIAEAVRQGLISQRELDMRTA